MQDTFWTPELWCEFLNQRPLIGALEVELEQFKSSKSPKKEWEIVAFKYYKDSNLLYKLREDGRYRADPHQQQEGFNLDAMLRECDTIHSVRRLSDGEVWSVQQKAGTPAVPEGRAIKAFKIIREGMVAEFEDGDAGINLLKRLPVPVLVTVDGKELFHGNKYFQLREDGHIIELEVHGWANYENKTGIFSTREAAEEYILNNRPLLSLNDVKEVRKSHCHSDDLLKALTALVKQKLNQ